MELCTSVPYKTFPFCKAVLVMLISCPLLTAEHHRFAVAVIKENNTCKIASPGVKPGNFSFISATCFFNLSLTCLRREEKKTQGRS